MQLTNPRKFWLKNGDRIEEWVRMKYHTYAVAVLSCVNITIGLGAFFTWLNIGFNIPVFAPFKNVSWGTLNFLVFLPLFTWFYSTMTQPIKKGYKIALDWRVTEKGRMITFIINISAMIIMLWVVAARYTIKHYVPTLSNIKLDPKEYNHLLTNDLSSFITLLYLSPLIVTIFILIIGYRHYKINEDILKGQFLTWEFKPLARFSYDLSHDKFDVIAGYDKETKKPLVLKEKSRYLHELIDGATGSGKTSTAILIRIAQDLIRISKGIPGGVVILEPKGDLVEDVIKLADELGVPKEKVFVVDPTKANTTKFNPFSGPLEAAAEGFRGTLNSLTGDQDAFFKGQQEETAALYTMLAKLRFNDFANITHLQRMYQDPRYLANITEEVRRKIDSLKGNPDISEQMYDRWDRIVSYFEDEVLEYKTFRQGEDIKPVLYPAGHRYAGMQMVESKKDKYVSGAKKYLNDIAMNSMLSDLMISKDGDKLLDLDLFLQEGGVLLINTALGELEELSLLLGQFFIRQFQSAVFRRPKDGTLVGEGENAKEYKRIPIFFNVDEFPLYINEAFERMLTLGRSYNVGSLIAIQSLGQLDSVIKGYRQTIMTNASSKTVFGRGAVEDNKIFSETFLEELTIEESLNESTTPVTVENQSWGYRHNTQKKLLPKFTPSDIASLPFKHMIVQLVKEDGSIGEARVVKGCFTSEAKFLKKYFKKLHLASERTEEEFEIDSFIERVNIPEITDSSTNIVVENQESHTMTQEESVENREIGSEEQVNEITLPPSDEFTIPTDEDIEFIFPEEEDGQLALDDIPELPPTPSTNKPKKRKARSKENEDETIIQLSILDNSVNEAIEESQLDTHSIPDEEILKNVECLVADVNKEIEMVPMYENLPNEQKHRGITQIDEIIEDDL